MSIYLSRIFLNPRSRQVQSELAHPYEIHRTLMRAFPETPGNGAREKHGVLFRADADDNQKVVKVYVQSLIEPDWSFLDELNGYLCTDVEIPGYEYKDIMTAFRKILTGQVFSFRLRANPTKRIANVTDGKGDLKGKRVGLLREEEQIEWLMRKGQECEKGKPGGFEILMSEIEDRNGNVQLVPRVNIRREGKIKGRKKKGGSPLYDMTHLSVRFDGLLRVTDADAFRKTLARGIGPGKAFGFGLLSVART